MTSQQIQNLLAENALFGALTSDRLKTLANGDGIRECGFAKDEILCEPGTGLPELGIIARGRAGVWSVDPERRLLLRTLEKNQIFGIVGLLDGGKTPSLIKAQTPVTLLLVKRDTVRELLGIEPAFLDRYLGYLTARVRFLNQKILYLTAGQAERRLALYLLSLPRTDDGAVTIPLSMTDLADLLDLGRASLYRAIDRLSSDGFLVKEDGLHLLHADTLGSFYK